MADLLHAAVDAHVGRPWSPPTFDCYGFVRAVYRVAYDIDLPSLVHDAGDVRSTMASCAAALHDGPWLPVSVPMDGDVVVMGRMRHPFHCGAWLSDDGGRIAHCCDPLGVVVQPMRAMVVAGWSGLRFYRHRDRMMTQ